MTVRKLKEKREQMIEFLLGNIIARSAERRGNDIVSRGYDGKDYLIKIFSRQADFKYDFKENPKTFDDDRRRLHAMKRGLASLVQDINSKGFIPGFVFLRAETDYPDPKEGGKAVNHGYFLKQRGPRRGEKAPNKDVKRLDQLELVVQQFYRHNSANVDRRIISEKNRLTYYPELIYFNTKEDQLEVVWFADTSDPEKFKKNYCPICDESNYKTYDHTTCRVDDRYRRYVASRNDARYTKRIMISMERGHRISARQTEAEKGVSFTHAELDTAKLKLPSRGLYIAMVR